MSGVGAGGSAGATAGASGQGGGAGTKIRFIHYNDLHAHLLPHTTLVATGPAPSTAKVAIQGGVARLATKLKGLRAELPSVAMNIGDTYHGGVEALYTQGEAVAKTVNAMGFDVGVPGNWDYAYGPIATRVRYLGKPTIGLQQCIAEGFAMGGGKGMGGGSVPTLTMPSYPNLAANVTFASGPGANVGDPFLPPTLLKSVGGVSVGFIGLSSDIVPRMHPMMACGLTFLGADEIASGDSAAWTSKYKTLVESNAAALRAKGATVVVVMSELGLQKNAYLADAIAPGAVDVVFSAHTHETVFQPITSKSGALVVEAGDDTYVGHMDVGIDGGKVTSRDWTLEPVGTDISEDPAVAALVAEARAPFLVADPNMLIPGDTGAQLALHQAITTVVGHAPAPLTRKNALDSSFNDFFAAALRSRANTQVVIAPGFRFDSPIATAPNQVEGTVVADGSVTVEDAFRFFPVVYKMGVAEVTGATLQGIVEHALDDVFSADVPLQNGGWVDGFGGFNATLNLAAASGSRVLSLTDSGGAPLAPAASFTVAGCRRPLDPVGVMCSHSGFVNVQDLLKGDGTTPWTDVEIFLDALSNPPLGFSPALVDTSGTPLWPAAPYVQPLGGATGP
jgi:2',3'-cyclic-nucleotide 2'-phosphodiesterase (5'-nucleotidase family)